MKDHERLDIFQRRSRNRLHLAVAVILYLLITMTVSALCLYIIHRAVHLNLNFWLLSSLFWLVFLIYILLRYGIGGKWALRSFVTLPPWKTDYRLENALVAAKLASGMGDRVRLFEIPNTDINAFTISLPDGSYALFAAQGVADKLPEREREAVIAHEIAHMQAGDTLIHTVMIHLAGRRALKKMVIGLGDSGFNPLKLAVAFALILGLTLIAWMFIIFFLINENSISITPRFSPTSFWPAIVLLFLVFALFFPLFMSKLLQLVLDKKREYYADMEAIYLTRDPVAVYRALKFTADDVVDVLLLPACYDTLLYNPVVSYSSYAPFRTQPTMTDRINRIKETFPQVDI